MTTGTKNRACTGKRRFVVKQDAIGAAIWRRRKFGARRADTTVYHCTHCGTFHIGHVPKGRR